ncbi:hypothetical protein Bca4012_043662 [Brassica carinata]
MDLRSNGGGGCDERMYHHFLQPLMWLIDPTNKTNKIRFKLTQRERERENQRSSSSSSSSRGLKNLLF